MKKYQPNSSYYPDDKDLLDFFHTARPSTRNIKKHLARSGIFISKRADKADAYLASADIDLSWESCIALSNIVPDRVSNKKWTSISFETDEDFSVIRDILNASCTSHDSTKDNISFHGSGNVLDIDVDYTEPDLSQTRLFQQVPKHSQVEVSKTDNGFQIRRTVDSKSNELVSKFEMKIKSEVEKSSKKLIRESILLTELKSAEARINFFFSLMDELEGFDYLDLISVKVSNMDSELPEDDDDETDEEKELSELIKSKIAKADFSGKGLRSDPQIKQFLEQGYFISSATWVVEAKDANWGRVEIHCGFMDESDSQIFEYKVPSLRPRNLDEYEPKRSPNPFEQRQISDILIKRAKEVYSEIKNQ
ncbi:hypothetical protein SAMN02745181_1088 [Rubritalea squalenifaciens DSM 18772]|uniref:Uncharacterized protein n=1 Tax=Rubritalea squalenifaciens DSM 18772 TaxID=1123071 RepID=A0A1M6EPJ3_9BACT|nr:hypothetical protein [Rubritalea squalenifaciens]SHI87437.1 hypothetical protein SAMN02745181_1088 [Rubritalea squalenifaciens DSM 18772]